MIDLRIGAAPHDKRHLYLIENSTKAIGKIFCNRMQRPHILDPVLQLFDYSWNEKGEAVKGKDGKYTSKKFSNLNDLLAYSRALIVNQRDKEILELSQSSQILDMKMFTDGCISVNMNGTVFIDPPDESESFKIEHARITKEGLDVLMYDNAKNSDMVLHLPKEAVVSIAKIIEKMQQTSDELSGETYAG